MVEYLVRTHLATNPGSLRPRGSIQRSSKHHTEHTSDGDASSLTHSLPTRHITQKNCKSTTVRRRVPENMELLAAKVVYSLTILTSSTQEVRGPTRESRLVVPSVAPTNSHAECRTDGDASFRWKTDPGSIPGGCTASDHLAHIFCTRRSDARRYISFYVMLNHIS